MGAPRPPGEAEAASVIAQEFEFILPWGFRDEHGELHRVGAMRLATALDELEPLRNTHRVALMTPASPSWFSRESLCPWERWRR